MSIFKKLFNRITIPSAINTLRETEIYALNHALSEIEKAKVDGATYAYIDIGHAAVPKAVVKALLQKGYDVTVSGNKEYRSRYTQVFWHDGVSGKVWLTGLRDHKEITLDEIYSEE